MEAPLYSRFVKLTKPATLLVSPEGSYAKFGDVIVSLPHPIKLKNYGWATLNGTNTLGLFVSKDNDKCPFSNSNGCHIKLRGYKDSISFIGTKVAEGENVIGTIRYIVYYHYTNPVLGITEYEGAQIQWINFDCLYKINPIFRILDTTKEILYRSSKFDEED